MLQHDIQVSKIIENKCLQSMQSEVWTQPDDLFPVFTFDLYLAFGSAPPQLADLLGCFAHSGYFVRLN